MSATFPERTPVCAASRPRAGQGGFALVSAIFLLVVLALLGAAMLTMSTVQHTTSAQDVQGSRAYQAARAGIEWNVYQIMAPENTNYAAAAGAALQPPFPCPTPGVVSAVNNLGGTLAGFNVAVTCVRTDHTEADNSIFVYNLTSTATSGTAGTPNYVQRQISATIAVCRKTADLSPCRENEQTREDD